MKISQAIVRNAISRKFVAPMINASREVKRATIVLSDVAVAILATVIAVYLRLGYVPPITRPLAFAAFLSIALCLAVFWLGGAYRTLFRYVGSATVRMLVTNVLVYAIIYASVFTYYGIDGVPRTLGLLQPAILLLLVLASRSLLAQLIGAFNGERAVGVRTKVLIYGAGTTGRQLRAAVRGSHKMEVVGFVDDDITLTGQILDNLKVYRSSQLDQIIARKDVSDVLLAMPSATRRRRNEVIDRLKKLRVNVRTLPGMLDLVHGRVKVSDLHDVAVDDLLGRNRVSPDEDLIRRHTADKAVLVTGAGGSIGSELCRQIIDGEPKTLILFDHSELALYTIMQEIEGIVRDSGYATRIVGVLGSVVERQLVRRVFEEWRPHVVYHAAAYKHVPLVEANIIEAMRNNVFGTLSVAENALECGTPHVVLISTDKAVRPTSVMGATKRLAEQVLQGLDAEHSDAHLSMVRFGNVLGSSGSVVPLFRAQAHAGGPITITDREMTRYFMLIPEAAQLVIQAASMAKGGEIFLLDMGAPVKIYELARSIVALSGLTVRDADNPEGDIEISEIGLRPGEKLYEELLIDSTAEPSDHALIMRATEAHIPWATLKPALMKLEHHLKQADVDEAVELLRCLVPEFSG